MTILDNAKISSLKIAWPMLFAGLFIGSMLSWGVLSGDSQGRVNIFYLLLVYLFVPLISIIASVISLLLGRGINLARFVSLLPIFSESNKTLLRKIQQLNLDKYWFLYQSQVAAIAYSVSSLFIFFILLLVTDLNFVWRSTILQPSDILPLLEFIAWPWQFWDAAQPTMTILETTQDSRLMELNSSYSNHGIWWKFILATQIFYSFAIRFILMLLTRWRLVSVMSSDIELRLQSEIKKHPSNTKETVESSPVVHELPSNVSLLNWDNISTIVLEMISNLGIDIHQLIEQTKTDTALEYNHSLPQLVIVKSWEGPMGELEDYLLKGSGFLFPVDWNENGLQGLSPNHFHEWQRFVNRLPNWQLFIPKSLTPKEDANSEVKL